MSSVLFVHNPRIMVVDMFDVQCTNCGFQFNTEDVNRNCPRCGTELFEQMRKRNFAMLFTECFEAIGIPRKKQVAFINNGDVAIKDLGICTEMSVAIDLNFQRKFGGQFKSFFVKDTFNQIKAYNFNVGD